MSLNHYDSLGLNRNASADEIKRAYRKRVKDCHPDATGEGHEAGEFRAAREAYETLSDPAKRREYDARSMRPRRAAADPAPFRRPSSAVPADIELILSPEEARGGGEYRIPLGGEGCPFCGLFGSRCPFCGGRTMDILISLPPGIRDRTLFSAPTSRGRLTVEVRIETGGF